MSMMSNARKARGYLLVEVMVAGSIIAVTLAVSVVFVVEGRKNVSVAAHRQAAMSIARGKCAEIVAALPVATADQTATAVGANFPGFLLTTSTVDASTTMTSTPSIAVLQREVTCTVQYPTGTGSVDDRASGSATDGRASVTVRSAWFAPQNP